MLGSGPLGACGTCWDRSRDGPENQAPRPSCGLKHETPWPMRQDTTSGFSNLGLYFHPKTCPETSLGSCTPQGQAWPFLFPYPPFPCDLGSLGSLQPYRQGWATPPPLSTCLGSSLPELAVQTGALESERCESGHSGDFGQRFCLPLPQFLRYAKKWG